MDRAAQLTPRGEGQALRLGRAAEIAFLAGRSNDAQRLVGQALAIAVEPELRGGLHHLLGRVLLLSGAALEAFTTLTSAVADVEERHPQLAAALPVDAALPAPLGRQPEMERDAADRG